MGAGERVEWDTHRQPRQSKTTLSCGEEMGEAKWNKEATRSENFSVRWTWGGSACEVYQQLGAIANCWCSCIQIQIWTEAGWQLLSNVSAYRAMMRSQRRTPAALSQSSLEATVQVQLLHPGQGGACSLDHHNPQVQTHNKEKKW